MKLPDSAAEEDRFAARTLGACIAEKTEIAPAAGGSYAITLKRTGPVAALPGADEKSGPDSRESYRLTIAAAGASIAAPSSAGLYYGAQTFCQMIEGSGAAASVPEAEVRDWPALPYRGTMVDMSHGGLPTEQEVKREIDFLARFKANQLYFYSETSIELDGYPLLSAGGRFTKEQVRRIIQYARERHIDVVPCLELYGHLHDLFRVEKYAGLAALPHGGEFNPENPQVKPLLADWVDQFARLFPSPLVHIGFDETWQIEQAAKQQGAGATPAKLFAEQLRTVAGLFSAKGKRVMAWGDIMIKYPEILEQLPPGMIAVAWQYEPDGDFQRWFKPLGARHVPTIIATGVSNWRELAPDLDFTLGNIDNFMAAARKESVLGMMNTLWADHGSHLQRAAWPAVAYGAVAPWQAGPVDRAAFFSDYARLLYSPQTAPDVAAAITKLNEAEGALQKSLGQATFWGVWQNPFSAAALKRSAETAPHLRRARLLAEDAQEHLYNALRGNADPALLRSLMVLARLVDYAGMKFLYAGEIAARWDDLRKGFQDGEDLWARFESDNVYQSHGRLADLMEEMTEIRKQFRAAWLDENTDYRLGSALGRFDAEYEYWRALQIRFQEFFDHLGGRKALPPLDEVLR